MVRTILRVFLVLGILLVFTGVMGVFIMAGVATAHDVVPIPVPSPSYLSSMQGDYKRAFRVPLTYNTFKDIESVAEHAYPLGGVEVYRSEQEVVYEGYRFGIRYYTSYMLDRSTGPNTLTIVTLVRLHGTRSGYLWRVIRPVHKRLAPYLLDRLAQAAPL
jgi:hypothetical protein